MSISLRIGSTPNYATVIVGSLRLEFSYRTVIAFFGPDDSAISQNIWGPTTGKHLNYIDSDKSKRIPWSDFEERLQAQLEKLGLNR